ncbi:MAG: hypothetical protein LN563_02075, partial [Rickettsia endosymbiont of Platyusa sonomae]|nr:hypothetical protein [Rickettsia endosymbiont of Platyusa sonomae]
ANAIFCGKLNIITTKIFIIALLKIVNHDIIDLSMLNLRFVMNWIKSRLNKDNLWNLMFWSGVVFSVFFE